MLLSLLMVLLLLLSRRLEPGRHRRHVLLLLLPLRQGWTAPAAPRQRVSRAVRGLHHQITVAIVPAVPGGAARLAAGGGGGGEALPLVPLPAAEQREQAPTCLQVCVGDG